MQEGNSPIEARLLCETPRHRGGPRCGTPGSQRCKPREDSSAQGSAPGKEPDLAAKLLFASKASREAASGSGGGAGALLFARRMSPHR